MLNAYLVLNACTPVDTLTARPGARQRTVRTKRANLPRSDIGLQASPLMPESVTGHQLVITMRALLATPYCIASTT